MVAPWYGGITITIAAPMSCARWLRSAQTRGAEVRGGHDHRHAAGDVLEDGFASSSSRSSSASTNCSEKLARMHRPLRAGIDHEVDAAHLARQVELACRREGGRHDREDAAVLGKTCHEGPPLGGGMSVVPNHRRIGACCGSTQSIIKVILYSDQLQSFPLKHAQIQYFSMTIKRSGRRRHWRSDRA